MYNNLCHWYNFHVNVALLTRHVCHLIRTYAMTNKFWRIHTANWRCQFNHDNWHCIQKSRNNEGIYKNINKHKCCSLNTKKNFEFEFDVDSKSSPVLTPNSSCTGRFIRGMISARCLTMATMSSARYAISDACLVPFGTGTPVWKFNQSCLFMHCIVCLSQTVYTAEYLLDTWSSDLTL